MAIVFVATSAFTQSSLEMVKELNKQRNIEIKRVKKENKGSMNSENRTKSISSINARYDKQVELALQQNLREESSSSSARKEEKDRSSKKFLGANVDLEGEGHFSGKTLSIKKGSDAYATVVTADANAYLTKRYAENLNSTGAVSSNGGMKIVISNEYRYADVNVSVKNKQNGQETAVFVRRNGKTSVNLLPGEYSYTASTNNGMSASNVKNFTLKLNNYYEFDGERVGYYLVVGSR